MGNVEADFRKKAAHGTGFDGDQWAPLSPRRVKKRLEKTRDFYLKKFGSRLPKKKEARGDVGYAEGGELPILIDEGDLVRSLSQGVINGAGQDVNYTATEHQEIALTDPNVIEMDTTVSGAHAHQEGSSSGKHPPQRRIVPDKIPDTWLEEATGVVAQIICEFIVETLQGPEPR